MATTSYVIALGSNRWSRFGSPARTIRAALDRIGGVAAVAPVIASAPVGPSRRRFANTAAIIATAETPPELLARLKAIERDFGRRRGRRWAARSIDLDIILWSGGCWADSGLIVPHRDFRARTFVLAPLSRIAANWRDPVSGRTIRQLTARGARARKVDPAPRGH
ncbi:2-amino-4-hydroxy-6-hydroxymethyldihydropteridine diphosphokinase [Sphingomonas sp. CCH18-H6]|uniref:2-amino-4-hydroxy-6- hydroxymethyldihydropteridine diphosphokinase n=1 Tax=Sphingomonas sp. CCH18-H6 TaxID=1768787 RepID=UPI00082D4F37|nr:2-amino-4-hydroxy-6-hydroxymethyldihydropteridine diphosphokinase [Sphingomonas sp. CCH18-H6]